MTKKHFEAMADYVAELRHKAASIPCEEHIVKRQDAWARVDEAYKLSLYLCNKFGERFDRDRFDKWIERKAAQP